MKKYLFIAFLFLLACNNNNEAPTPNLNNVQSQICPNVVGPAAVYWDLTNGIPRTDLPGFVPPTIKTPGGSFLHPDYPPLSFQYPAGYAAEAIRAPQTLGVNLLRQDNRVIWRTLNTVSQGFPSAREIRQTEIQQILQFLGVNGNNIQLLCLNENQTSPASGVAARRSVSLIQAGGFTGLISAQVTGLQNLPTSSIMIQTAIGPTNEFNQLVFDTFLAIEFQMLYGPDGEFQDTDGDGIIDSIDRFPLDPTRS